MESPITSSDLLVALLRKGLRSLNEEERAQLLEIYNLPECQIVYSNLFSRGVYISRDEVIAFLASETWNRRPNTEA